jgi:hypothetical protein
MKSAHDAVEFVPTIAWNCCPPSLEYAVSRRPATLALRDSTGAARRAYQAAGDPLIGTETL